MTKKEIAKLDCCTVGNTPLKYIEISVFIVEKCNFNDERLIETRWLCLEEIKDKPLLWQDVYLGKNPRSVLKIAVAYVSGTDVYLLEDDGIKVRAVKKNEYTHYYSDDYDERRIISAHIEAATRSWE